jgi:hypothetical protein
VAYVSAAEFKEWVRLQVDDTVDDTAAALVLSAAERAVTTHCGRTFDQVVPTANPATARLFAARFGDLVWVDDFWTTSGLIVETRSAASGAYTTWATADYQLEPLNGIADGVAGWPWFRIRATGSRRFPVDARFATVRVTAKWGWSAVPDDVQLATKLQAALLLKRREAPNGLLEFAGDGASLRVSPIDGHVMRLLQPYVTTSRMIV